MSGFIVALWTFGVGAGLMLLLWAARRLSDWLGSDEPPLWRALLWLAVSLAALAGLFLLGNEWASLAVAVALSAWVFVGTALEQRAGPLRRRLSVLGLYAALFCASVLHLRARGMLDGLSASPALSFALHDQLTQLALPFAERLGAVAPKADPAHAVWLVAGHLSAQLVLWLALSSFGFAVYAAAYLSRRALPLPGAQLFGHPRIVAVAFVVLLLASAFLPRALGLVIVALYPLFVADGGALLSRWLGRLRARGLLFALIGGAAFLWPVVLLAIMALGLLAQLLGLRELLPFAKLDESPLKRPRLSSLGLVLGAASLTMLGGTFVAQRSLRIASPKLGAPTEACGSIDPSVDWQARVATFQLATQTFSIDLDETSLDAGSDPAAACQRLGKRVCTSDEWYLACACTYPLEVEAGPKSSTLYGFVARAERERAEGPPGPRQPTTTADKRSELRGLITGKSEIVAQSTSKGLLLAGPNDVVRDAWSVDCRHRAFMTPGALGSDVGQLAAVRCCR